MPKDGNKTRKKILEESTSLVLRNGFAGTTIDHILAQTQITKGAFFYHFKSKADLALSLIRDFAEKDASELQRVLEHTSTYNDQPRERLLRFVQWFIDAMSGLENPYPGCLYASYVYEPDQFDEEIKDVVTHSILLWREALVKLLKEAEKQHVPKIKYNAESLADLFTVILEGAFIVSKALNDPKLPSLQLGHYKQYLELIFEMSGGT